ncbi:hypothetical protein M0802_012640 [Mischocyttarus mexicanus]|nr:hypothetical protein M0802_012640 [Mischocyttarus mexicanus]
MKAYENVVEILKTDEIEFYTYTPSHREGKTLVLRGIEGGFNEMEVLEAIKDLKIEGVAIEKISKLIFNKTTPDKYHFLLKFMPNSIIAPLWKCKSLLNHRCRRKRLKRPPIF